jgi:very-short-patch-repair endonuclease
MTFSEARLWSCLKDKKIQGRRFRRQHSIGDFIVDFFCYSVRIVIEVDGSSHDNYATEMNDIERDNYLVKEGFRVLRFDAKEIQYNIEDVIQEIETHFIDAEKNE